jgi:hypothetical protein
MFKSPDVVCAYRGSQAAQCHMPVISESFELSVFSRTCSVTGEPKGDSMSKKPSAAVAASVLSIALWAVPSALAAPTLTLSTGADPAESITTQLVATGTASSAHTQLSVTVKPTGGQGCGANYQADASGGSSTVFFEESGFAEGPFSRSANHTFENAGSYLLCGWLNDNTQTNDPVVATASLTVTVRPPHLALSVSAPASVAVKQTFQLVTTAQAEVQRRVEAFMLPNTGRGCAANASAASVSSGVGFVEFPAQYSDDWAVVGGPFSETANESLASAGQYLVCAYVQYQSDQSPPEIMASASITAVAPPPPCVVPAYSSSVTKQKAAEQAIAASGCALGAVRHVASRTVRPGYIISFSAAAGKHLPPATAIGIVVSTGPPCVVPHVSAGTAFSIAERRLSANHCSVGKISAMRSRRYHHGRVLRLGARTGQILPTHAPIAIILSGHRR